MTNLKQETMIRLRSVDRGDLHCSKEAREFWTHPKAEYKSESGEWLDEPFDEIIEFLIEKYPEKKIYEQPKKRDEVDED